MSDGLPAIRLLLIRPDSGHDDFAMQARDSGARVFHHPVMSVEPISSRAIEATLRQLDGWDKTIFVSRTAVRLCFSRLRALSLRWPSGLEAYAVGKSTAGELLKEGVDVQVPEKMMSSEGLLALSSLQHVAGKTILIFCGEGGRELLAHTLGQRGAAVSRCELYRRQPNLAEKEVIESLLAGQELDLIVAHSGELMENLLSLVGEGLHLHLKDLPIVVPSARVAALAFEAGFREVVQAGSALPEAMVSAIAEWYSKQ